LYDDGQNHIFFCAGGCAARICTDRWKQYGKTCILIIVSGVNEVDFLIEYCEQEFAGQQWRKRTLQSEGLSFMLHSICVETTSGK
jgi:hypothetical protein